MNIGKRNDNVYLKCNNLLRLFCSFLSNKLFQQKKVGEYLRIGTSLEIENFTVEVVKTDNHSHYNVSLVQVIFNNIALEYAIQYFASVECRAKISFKIFIL